MTSRANAWPVSAGDVFSQKIQARFVHTDDTDGRKVIFPVEAGAFLDVPQIELGIGIEILFGKPFENLSFDGKALDGEKNLFLDGLEKFGFIL